MCVCVGPREFYVPLCGCVQCAFVWVYAMCVCVGVCDVRLCGCVRCAFVWVCAMCVCVGVRDVRLCGCARCAFVWVCAMCVCVGVRDVRLWGCARVIPNSRWVMLATHSQHISNTHAWNSRNSAGAVDVQRGLQCRV
jgi:hypothetical protein